MSVICLFSLLLHFFGVLRMDGKAVKMILIYIYMFMYLNIYLLLAVTEITKKKKPCLLFTI